MKGVFFLDNSRMMQRNGRITNLSSYNSVPHYNRSVLRQNETCSCTGSGTSCGINTNAGGCSRQCSGLGISSVVMQEWRNIYELEKGFCAGTIFGELDLPFCGSRGVRQ